MTDDTFWMMFADTGDPMSWLMYRAAEKKPEKSADDRPPEVNSGASD